ncbi:ferritin-like domain-containing protein [Sphingomonas sp. LT1P40]|uniref:ferritin-like domain-containing protein n=1 Tax=Alteristakelama amylovorans TaxID=3096166 RepID=UPI002FC7607E
MTQSVADAVRSVLETAHPAAKVGIARRVARDWRLGRLDHRFDVAMPDQPAAPDLPELVSPGKLAKRGAGSERGRIALIHALAHIEFVAIDLAFDMAGRFGGQFPRAFTDDWLKVGADEAMHFALLDRRLRQLGSFYGAMPAHGGLWEAAAGTAHDAAARLAVVPMVLEARGLDVTPVTIERFEAAGDVATGRILRRILNDEIIHVAAGTRWFESSCAAKRINPETEWKALIARHFHGSIKPPFNDSARATAGLTRGYYESLAAS